MLNKIKRVSAGTLLAALITLTGCNTVQGVGKDIQSVGSLGNDDNTSTVTTVKTTEVVYPQ